MKKYIEMLFNAKALRKPGGQVYRTIASLPPSVTPEEIVKCANEFGLGHRIENGVLRIFARS